MTSCRLCYGTGIQWTHQSDHRLGMLPLPCSCGSRGETIKPDMNIGDDVPPFGQSETLRRVTRALEREER